MILTTKNIDELKKIYKQEFNTKLSDEEATEIAHKMVNLHLINSVGCKGEKKWVIHRLTLVKNNEKWGLETASKPQ